MMRNYLKKLVKPLVFSSVLGLGMFKIYNKNLNKKVFALSKGEADRVDGKVPEYFENVNVEELTKQYKNLTIIESRAVDILIGQLRDKNLSLEKFRDISRRIFRYVIEEAVATEYNQEAIMESPLGYYKTLVNPHNESDYVAVSIMRSGNGMVEEIMSICPKITIGKILLQRDESSVDKKPIFYFEKLPQNINDKRIFILDPMLGSGGSIRETIRILIQKGVKEENIIFLNLISSLDGLNAVLQAFPNIKFITAKVDKYLLPNKYIAPGIGDFGDRYYGTSH